LLRDRPKCLVGFAYINFALISKLYVTSHLLANNMKMVRPQLYYLVVYKC